MPYTEDGIWYPDTNTRVDSLETIFATQASSVQTVLRDKMLVDGVPKFADASARTTAFGSIPPVVGTLSYNVAMSRYEKWNGTAWVPIIDDFPPVTGKVGNTMPVVNLPTNGSYYYTSQFLSFKQRANVSVAVFAIFCVTQASGSPSTALIRAIPQYSSNNGTTWTDCQGYRAATTLTNNYAYDATFASTFTIPPATSNRDIIMRAGCAMVLGNNNASRFDYTQFMAMSFGQTDNL